MIGWLILSWGLTSILCSGEAPTGDEQGAKGKPKSISTHSGTPLQHTANQQHWRHFSIWQVRHL
ncbi:hypothetical protein COCSUDRAFT_32386 [Coccomyxa subellipsoidea C-169]|uniref:Uncharacterized protein n=1 Tax=Coccomyxa subellipsoidea (strain C-169) TaxID=574566 RepID=I0Z592_COCSC|nr:hypothetical protein COCSUDRAFT_32386 [Coccomyxa subellipsoidea C-169]EIE25811.1 hypothetical protein COCSUDRAFT_32386 [Coccomyxa subellipsoidea C-169]|eukprot:XP_005650355.1 hypothetical protein COCSUDRAFT_32386 [Coccomyxa subellipsoidea C-169]